MSEIKLKTEEYDITRTAAMKFGRVVIDESLIVPDVKPDIKKILDVSARTYVTDVTPGQDKVHVEGIVKATVLYLPDGDVIGNVKALDMSREFSSTIDSKGVTADNIVTAEAEIDTLDSTLINSRKVNIRVGVNIGVKIMKIEKIELPVGIEISAQPATRTPLADLLPFKTRQEEPEPAPADDSIQLQKTPLRFADKQFSSDGSIIIRGQHEISAKLPQIGEVLCATAWIEPDSAVASSGSVELGGNAKISVLYEDAEETSENTRKSCIRTAEFTVPYNEIFEAPKCADDMECEVEYTVREIYTEIMDNMDGEQRMLGVEVVVGVNVCGYLISEPGVVSDGYCTDGCTFTPEFSETSPEQLVDSMTAQITHKCTAKRKPTDAEISGICSLSATKTSVDDIDISDGIVSIKGNVTIKALCSSNDENQPLFPIEVTTPFEHSFETDSKALGSKTACDAKIFVNHLGYNISGSDTVDIRMVIGISIKLIKTDRVKNISSFDIIEPEGDSNDGMQSYIIYFVQPGDTLWNIAKRYKTTVDDIVANNGISNPEKLSIGQKLRIKK